MGDFEQLMRDIEAEANAEGPAAVAELAALDTRFGLASQLMQLRQQLKITQKQLAKASGVDQAEISRIERGEINPTVLTVAKLLRPLGARLSITAGPGSLAA
jgi:DNA-binding XRE family transcriptional regulator